MSKRLFLILSLLLFFCFAPKVVKAAEYYMDNVNVDDNFLNECASCDWEGCGGNCDTDYNPTTRDCAADGTPSYDQTVFKDLTSALGYGETNQLSDGDTLWVRSGIHTGARNREVNENDDSIIKGYTGDPNDVIIDGENNTSTGFLLLDYGNAITTIQDITFKNLNITTGNRGGIYVSSTHDVVITNCIIDDIDSTAIRTAGIYIQNGSDANISDAEIKNCDNSYTGDDCSGGILVYGGVSPCNLTISNSNIHDNSLTGAAPLGSAGIAESTNTGNLIILNTDFYDNSTNATSLTIFAPPALAVVASSSVTLTDVNIYSNTALGNYGSGGARIQTSGGGVVTLTRVNIYNNSSNGGDSVGGVKFSISPADALNATLNMTDCNIYGNTNSGTSGDRAGGINIYGVRNCGYDATLTRCKIYNNQVTAGSGEGTGGLKINGEDVDITVNNSQIYDNVGNNYGNVFLEQCDSELCDESNLVTFNNCTIEGGTGILADGVGTDTAYDRIIFNNSIIWGDQDETYDVGSGDIDFNYCILNESSVPDGGGSSNNSNSNPSFTNLGSNDFTLQSTSPAIDAGVDLNLSTDYLGNYHYDMPSIATTGSAGSYTKTYVDIGAYEYITPPDLTIESATHSSESSWYNTITPTTITFATPYDTTAKAITTDFRYLINQTLAPSAVSVQAGTLLDDLITFNAQSSITSDGVWYIHTIAQNENDTDTFSANYDTYTIQYDSTAPSSVGAPTFGTITTTSIIINKPTTATEEGSGLYQWQTRRNTATELGLTAVATTQTTDSSLSENTQYTYDVQFKDNANNLGNYGTSASKYTLIEPPTAISFGTIGANSITLSATGTLPNLDSGTSAIFFDETTESSGGADSSWTQTNSYQNTGLSENTQYTYKAKAKNGDSTETAYTAESSKYTLIESPTGASWDSIEVNSITLSAGGTLPNLTLGNSGLYFENTTASVNSNWTQTNSWENSSLSENTAYTFQITSRNGDATANDAVSAGTKYTLVDTPTNFSVIIPSNNVATLTVDELPNSTLGSSGYYFYRNGDEASHNSGWIQTNTWQDTDFSCNTNYTWYVKYRNGDGTETTAISVASANHPYPCGGGFFPPTSLPTTPVFEPNNETIQTESINEPAQTTQQEQDNTLIQVAKEAIDIIKESVITILEKIGLTRNIETEQTTQQNYVAPLINNNNQGVSTLIQDRINIFITYGTQTTRPLGIGERAGVVHSYQKAYNKLPDTGEDWQDVIKIANGRFPKEQSIEKEKQALKEFTKIYKRLPDFKNSNDEAALKVIAYGIRPKNRNLDSEKSAIQIFKAIYNKTPTETQDWDITRAIAYSGATR